MSTKSGETHSYRIALILLAGLCLSAFTSSALPPPPDEEDIPAWVLDHLAQQVGRWVTDNAAYKGDQEPFDAYGLEWAWGLGEQSITGRLFGIQAGEEAGTFWEFRVFWHPGEQQLKLYQYGGNGAVGIGSIQRTGEHKTEALQTFFGPDGSSSQIGHREEIIDGAQHSQSFNIGEDGSWTINRSYVWHRESE